jgi:hypothetical protein
MPALREVGVENERLRKVIEGALISLWPVVTCSNKHPGSSEHGLRMRRLMNP